MTDWRMEYQPESDTLELRLYDTIEGDSWWTESETSAKAIAKKLAEMPNAKEIKIFINSLGGSVMEGLGIYNQLKRHSAHKTVYIDGFACSIASVIAMAGDTVIMPKNAVMMIHNAWVVAAGNAAQLRKTADDLDVINAASTQAYLDRAGDKLSPEKLTEMLDAETYLTAEQCIEFGLADKFDDSEEEKTDTAKEEAVELAKQQAINEEMQRRHERAMAVINKYFQ
jgi:ATP-dependent protease ClpP protease subunit